ncbi:alpha-2-macroglobulin family protein [Pseudomonas ulcerans]|uniref:alpha-2-macroglobulin family protein n=1 Tax=Pseudomonas ulcerans TaxID=3115852 RepID=UPI0038B61607
MQRTLVGYPEQAPARVSKGMSVTRSWFNSDGQPFDPAKVKVGDLVVVRLNVSSESAVPDALLVEMAPAGFELEAPATARPAADRWRRWPPRRPRGCP